MTDDDRTPRETPASKQFAPVDCPLCKHPELWHGGHVCPGCSDGKKISRFKSAELFAKYPELSRLDTERELAAVTPEKA